jgi:hypothetical protein
MQHRSSETSIAGNSTEAEIATYLTAISQMTDINDE